MISDNQYLGWHKKISGNLFYKWLWAFLGIYLVLFYFIAGGYFALVNRNWKIAVATGVAVLFTRYVVCEIIHAFYKKPHPYQKLGFSPPKSMLFSFLDQKADAFPSEHASCAAAVAMVFFGFYPALGAAGFIAAAVIGAARVVLGYHEVSDVIAGWVAGLATGLLTLYLGQRFW